MTSPTSSLRAELSVPCPAVPGLCVHPAELCPQHCPGTRTRGRVRLRDPEGSPTDPEGMQQLENGVTQSDPIQGCWDWPSPAAPGALASHLCLGETQSRAGHTHCAVGLGRAYVEHQVNKNWEFLMYLVCSELFGFI